MAVDLAGGDGSNAVWLAGQGFDVTLTDVSPVACRRASELAARAGVELRCEVLDLTAQSLSESRFDVAVCTNYLQRDLWARVVPGLAKEAWLVWIHPTLANLERHERPSRRFLLEADEAATILQSLDPAVALVFAEETWWGDEPSEARHLARVVAKIRRP